MSDKRLTRVTGQILEDDVEFTLVQLSRACGLSAEQLMDLVDQGVVEPEGSHQSSWRFRGVAVRRVRKAQRLRHDLGVNLAGAALALDLMEELEQLRARLQRIEH